jgi:hypothetical protein
MLSACYMPIDPLLALNDTHAAVQTLRDHIYNINSSTNVGNRTLSGSLVDCLRGLFDDLSAVEKLVPVNVSSVAAKVKWVFDKRGTIDGLMQIMESRKMTLVLNLGIVGLSVPIPATSTRYPVHHFRQN